MSGRGVDVVPSSYEPSNLFLAAAAFANAIPAGAKTTQPSTQGRHRAGEILQSSCTAPQQ